MQRILKLNLLLSLVLSIVLLFCSCDVFYTIEDLNTDSYVRFVDVGQGECAVIYSQGKTAVIDTGTAETGEELSLKLKKWNIEVIDVLIISHLHVDHTGAVPVLSQNFDVKNLILPELVTDSEGMGDVLCAINAVENNDGNIYNALQGMNFKLGEFEVTILASYGSFDEVNNHSLFVMAEIEEKRFFFSGDAEKKAEDKLLEENLNLDCQVIKAGHHGSSTSNSDDLLKALSPDYAVVSCGEGNSYGHPHKEVLESFKEKGIKCLRTDTQGDITFYIRDGELSLTTEY